MPTQCTTKPLELNPTADAVWWLISTAVPSLPMPACCCCSGWTGTRLFLTR